MKLDLDVLKRKVADHISYSDVSRDLSLAKKELDDAIFAENELKIHVLKEIIENLNEVIEKDPYGNVRIIKKFKFKDIEIALFSLTGLYHVRVAYGNNEDEVDYFDFEKKDVAEYFYNAQVEFVKF